MSFNFSPKIVTENLTLYLDAANSKSYLVGSTSLSSISKNEFNSVLINNLTYSTENLGTFILNGTDQYINADYSSLLSFGTNDFSIMYSFFISSFSPSTFPTIIDTRIISNDFGYADYIRSIDNTFRLYWNNTVQYISNNKIYQNQWYVICVTKNGTNIKVYINGLYDGTISTSDNLSSGQLKIGRNVNSTSTSFLNGRFQNLLVYDRELNSNEVLQNYNALKNRYI